MNNLNLYQPRRLITARDLTALERKLGHIEYIGDVIREAIREVGKVSETGVEEVLIAVMKMHAYEMVYAANGLPPHVAAWIEQQRQNLMVAVDELSREHCRQIVEIIGRISFQSDGVGLLEELHGVLVRRLTG